jgi:hypothetical protein
VSIKKCLGILSLAFAICTPNIAQADISFSSTQWPPFWNQNVDYQRTPLTHYAFDIVDTFNSGSTDYSFIRVMTPGPQPFCSSLSDPFCQDIAKKYGWWIIRLLPPCATQDEKTECIESLEVTKSGKSIRYVSTGTYARNTFPADPANGLGVGSGSSLWVDPQNPNSGNGYLITVSGDAGAAYGSKSFPLSTFDATVVPYTTVTGNYDKVDVQISNGEGVFSTKPGTKSPPECIWVQPGKCGLATEFESDVKLKFLIHLPSTLSRWVVGRLGNPTIAIDSLGEANSINYERVTVDANPISVPMIGGKVKIEEASQAIKDEWTRNNCPNCAHGIWAVNVESSNDGALHFMEMFKPYIGDKSMVSMKVFSLSSMGSSGLNLAKCDRKGSISGLVATNASAYVGTPPQFDGTTLNYKVGAMHYTADGEVFKGVYDLFMPVETAKCLYGFSDAPISASVSVTSEAGENTVATSVLSNRDGWIHLNASGFTFSNPTLKIKFEGNKSAGGSLAPLAPTPSSSLKIQWCAKGNAKKKVTGANPVCPKGYKKIASPLAR